MKYEEFLSNLKPLGVVEGEKLYYEFQIKKAFEAGVVEGSSQSNTTANNEQQTPQFWADRYLQDVKPKETFCGVPIYTKCQMEQSFVEGFWVCLRERDGKTNN